MRRVTRMPRMRIYRIVTKMIGIIARSRLLLLRMGRNMVTGCRRLRMLCWVVKSIRL